MNPKETHYTLARARALHELQLQQGIRLCEGGKALGYAFPVEFLDEESWVALAPLKPQLLLSAVRATAAGIAPQNGVAALDTSGFSREQCWQWAVGNRGKLAAPPAILPSPAFGKELITLAKQAAVIPALLWIPSETLFPETFALDIEALRFVPKAELRRGETVALPIEGAEDATLTGFRTRSDASVHLALTIGDIHGKEPPLVRVHSSCVTGDLLGSLRCDCGGQLQQALAHMKKARCGILLYLHQEGRGIGISSKLRAYALQENGVDTFAANEQLGFAADERDFSLAGAMLQSLGVSAIRLLTNNPDKIEALSPPAITVTERLPLVTDATAHNHAYLDAKKIKHGHF
ncbi:MAG: GTP cyclohydrolase II [Alphaproteobacteria bacterium]|nr:GTP cyclohydrolase II [Alphaproteobacteria bacterium]